MSTWYKTGTVGYTNGQTIVTGSGAGLNWIEAKIQPGDALRLPNREFVEIIAILSSNQLEIAEPYLGVTSAGHAYTIKPTTSRDVELLTSILSFRGSFEAVRDGIGAGRFPVGTLTTPAGRFIGDEDTGFDRIYANAFGIIAGGAIRAVFDGDNNTIFGGGTAPVYNAPNRTTMQINGVEGALLAFLTADTKRGYIFATNEEVAMEIEPSCTLRLNTFGNKSITISTTNTPRWVFEGGGTYRPATDNTLPIGAAGNRVSGIFLGTSPTVTSDERDKAWRSELSEEELAVAREIADEFGIFQYHDAIAAKGTEGARLHYGPRAQRVFELFDKHGLDWRRYAWCCHDEWSRLVEDETVPVETIQTQPVFRPTGELDPETGEPLHKVVFEPVPVTQQQKTGRTITIREAGDRYGIRYEQMTLWVIAALRADSKADRAQIGTMKGEIAELKDEIAELKGQLAMLSALEERIAALELRG